MIFAKEIKLLYYILTGKSFVYLYSCKKISCLLKNIITCKFLVSSLQIVTQKKNRCHFCLLACFKLNFKLK